MGVGQLSESDAVDDLRLPFSYDPLVHGTPEGPIAGQSL